jgi:hypothetical protein
MRIRITPSELNDLIDINRINALFEEGIRKVGSLLSQLGNIRGDIKSGILEAARLLRDLHRRNTDVLKSMFSLVQG